MISSTRQLIKQILPKPVLEFLHSVKKRIRVLRGDVFCNPGPISAGDFEQLKIGIDTVRPKVFIELGTGSGVSARAIYGYLRERYPDCHFYTMDIFRERCELVQKEYTDCDTFHTVYGLSVRKEETQAPAFDELVSYSGPQDVLRQLLTNELAGQQIDIAFIDSRKGSAVAEFKVLESRLADNGIIYCHDILNGGKGVEVLEYLKAQGDRFNFQVINTGPDGMIEARFKCAEEASITDAGEVPAKPKFTASAATPILDRSA